MRLLLIAPVLAFLLLACQSAPPGVPEEAIEVTTLEAAVPEAEGGAVPEAEGGAVPEAEGGTVPAEVEVEIGPEIGPEEGLPEVEVVRTAGQVLCEASGGQWVAAGETGAFYCASQTRDAGKRCSKKTQCQGVCLARSGTCSPITPLYGCNDVLEKDGRQVTLCID